MIMKNFVKKICFVTAFIIIMSSSVHAQVKKLEEKHCLHLGSYAEHIVEGIELGISEKQMLAANFATKGVTAETKATMNSIVSFVFTTKQSRSELRNIVYLKCKAGEYDSLPKRKNQRS